jgi:hypothetical protein
MIGPHFPEFLEELFKSCISRNVRACCPNGVALREVALKLELF